MRHFGNHCHHKVWKCWGRLRLFCTIFRPLERNLSFLSSLIPSTLWFAKRQTSPTFVDPFPKYVYVNFLHFFISAKKESINLLLSLLAPIIQGAWKELLCRLCNLRTVLKTKPKMSNIHLFVWNSDFVEAKTQPDQSFEEMWKQHANERLVETKEERSERKIS